MNQIAFLFYSQCGLFKAYVFCVSLKDGDGTIDFREYVIGVTVLCRPANNEEVIQTAFKVMILQIEVMIL